MNTKLLSALLAVGLLLTVCGILSISLNIKMPLGAPSVTPSVTPLGRIASVTPVGTGVPVTGDSNREWRIVLYGLLGLFGVVVLLSVYNVAERNGRSSNNRPPR